MRESPWAVVVDVLEQEESRVQAHLEYLGIVVRWSVCVREEWWTLWRPARSPPLYACHVARACDRQTTVSPHTLVV